MNRKSPKLDIAKVIEEFKKSEETAAHRNGTFKIEKPFDEALDTILRVKPTDELTHQRAHPTKTKKRQK